ncbi:hypothetical protein GUITHDRAFT_142806 [Guillardia theta CCMP2712]|uniref:WDR59/RTC1-like RING zinc finger domain-containing protein n=2 Tax=Guillardia theta TaxID=55529 RepID=L1IVN3_GUITC|nr:hypothetical protein GUITHDRAFT_142806 [Guillardia theta CCMP2712]EKX40303.1 hypothetical protein GUITHDRAFT_142806 [Guillardia theta CCMP2712]|eukprot:XP_005827283.1 hypothetical protein GUITHDRAFT_142806 [Guillardia theta CCMP2712]
MSDMSIPPPPPGIRPTTPIPVSHQKLLLRARTTNSRSFNLDSMPESPPEESRSYSNHSFASFMTSLSSFESACTWQNAKLKLADEPGLVAVSQSPDGKRLAAGGGNVLSILDMSELTRRGGNMKVIQNILAKSRMETQRSARHKSAGNVQDLRWHPASQQFIASAASNGSILLWDITTNGNVVWEGKDHTRTVWRLAWCQPSGNEYLLCSGSLDGTIRLWDRRGSCHSCISISKHNQQEAVRDLRVCGADPWKLAAGLECGNEGAIVVWDLRAPQQKPLFRVKEETAVHAVDWHPEHSSILATGRASRAHAAGCLKVWDMKEAGDGTEALPIAKIITPDGVSNIMWRPTYRTHVATTYMSRLANVHVWDLPSFWTPLASLCGHTKPVTDMVWQDAHVFSQPNQLSDDCCWIFSCSKDGTVQRQHLQNGYLPFRHMRNSTFSADCYGDVYSSYSKVNRDTSQLTEKTPNARQMAKSGSFLHVFPSLPKGKPARKAGGPLSRASSGGSIAGAGAGAGDSEVVVMRKLASRYAVGGGTWKELCRTNNRACLDLGLTHTAASWSFLSKLSEGSEVQGERHGGGSSSRPEINCPPSISFSSTPDLVDPLLGDMMRNACLCGDVVTCATMALVLGRSSLERIGVTKLEFVSWLNGYLDLLFKLRLYSIAAVVMKSCGGSGEGLDESDAIVQIAQRNMRNTSVRVKFGSWRTKKDAKKTAAAQLRDDQGVSREGALVPPGSPKSPSRMLPPLPSNDSFRLAAARGRHTPLPQRAATLRAGSGSREGADFSSSGDNLAGEDRPWFACSGCDVKVKGDTPNCSNCGHSAIRCAICRLSVHGAFMWCQGCGHGGHMQHMYKWFQRHPYCPAGCGHKCLPSSESR